MSTVKRFVLGIIAALYIIAPSTLAYAATKTYMLTFNGNCNDSSYTISQTSMRLLSQYARISACAERACRARSVAETCESSRMKSEPIRRADLWVCPFFITEVFSCTIRKRKTGLSTSSQPSSPLLSACSSLSTTGLGIAITTGISYWAVKYARHTASLRKIHSPGYPKALAYRKRLILGSAA